MIEIDSMAWVEKREFLASELSLLDLQLTVQPKGFNGDNPEPIKLMAEVVHNGRRMIGLPLIFGLKTFQKKYGYQTAADLMENHVIDCRAHGTRTSYDAVSITPRDKAQADFFDATYRNLKARPALLVCAATGSGKTVMAMNTIAKLGTTALAVTPNGRIAGQWREAARKFLGLKDSEIGTIGGGKREWQGKKLVIAIIHNLIDGDKYPDEFYTYFGFAVYDECHNLSARAFRRSMEHIPARYKLAMSATPYRKDGCERVFKYQFGEVGVTQEGDALEATVKVFNYNWPKENELDKKPVFVKRKLVMANRKRNQWCAKAIASMYNAGRHILVMSEEIAHLQNLIGLCADLGIPDTDLGLYTRTYIDENGKAQKITDDDLDWVEKHCRIIFSLYVMAKDGIDIPRLDAGIDVYPRSEAVQVIGRIRRPLEGKPEPLWVTIRDRNVGSLMRSCTERIKEYRKSNCKVLESGKCLR